MSRPVCPGAVSAMDKLMMRGAHHRQSDIRLRQRDAMLYTIQIRDKRGDLRAGGSKRVGTNRHALERISREYRAESIDAGWSRVEKRVDANLLFGSDDPIDVNVINQLTGESNGDFRVLSPIESNLKKFHASSHDASRLREKKKKKGKEEEANGSGGEF